MLSLQRVHRMIAGHLADVARGTLRVVVDRRYPLAEAAAHAYVESREAFGRVLLVPRVSLRSSIRSFAHLTVVRPPSTTARAVTRTIFAVDHTGAPEAVWRWRRRWGVVLRW